MIESRRNLESLLNAAMVAGDKALVISLTERLRIAKEKETHEDDNSNVFGVMMEAEILGSLMSDDTPSYEPTPDSTPDFGGSDDGFGGGGGGDSWE